MLKVLVDYRAPPRSVVIVERMVAGLETVRETMSVQQLRLLQEAVRTVYVDPSLIGVCGRGGSATVTPRRWACQSSRPTSRSA